MLTTEADILHSGEFNDTQKYPIEMCVWLIVVAVGVHVCCKALMY